MANNAQADGGRTDTKRFSDDLNVETLIEGDRIDTRLVARHVDQLGSPLRRTVADEPDEPATQLVQVTETRGMDDSHTAILYEPETETFVRAGRIDSNQAMTQAEADWTVRAVGSEVVVKEISELERPENEQDDRAERYVQSWVSTLFDEIRYNGGDMDFHDEIRMSGSALSVQDYDGRRAVATIALE